MLRKRDPVTQTWGRNRTEQRVGYRFVSKRLMKTRSAVTGVAGDTAHRKTQTQSKVIVVSGLLEP